MNSCFKKTVSLEEQEIQMEDRFLRGRETAFMIYEQFQSTGAHEAVLDYSDLLRITSYCDDFQISEVPDGSILESLF